MARGMPLQALFARFFGKGQTIRLALNWYAPYLGAGVRITHVSDDFREVRVTMPLRWYNRNYVGTHYGGSLYSMVDPFYMLMLIENLGKDVIVWDKAATVRFRRPGTGTVHADFRIEQPLLDDIRARLDAGEDSFDITLPVTIVDASDKTVAEVDKVLHIRSKAYDKARRARRDRASA